MSEERFNVVLLGQLSEGTDSAKVIENLSRHLKIPPSQHGCFSDGKRRILKRNLPLEQARKMHQTLASFGVLSEIELVFDGSIFQNSTVRVADRVPCVDPSPDPEPDTSFPKDRPKPESGQSAPRAIEYQFDGYCFAPAVYYPKSRVPIVNAKGHQVGEITVKRHIFGWATGLLITVFIAFLVERLVLDLSIATLGTGKAATVLAIFSLFAVLLFLPKYLIPRKIFAIALRADHGTANEFQCIEQKTGTNLTRSFNVQCGKENAAASMKKSSVFSTYSCKKYGKPVFLVGEDMDVEDAMTSVGDTVREEVTVFGDILSFILDRLESSPAEPGKIRYTVQEILNAERSKVANLKCEKQRWFRGTRQCILQINPEAAEDNDQGLIFAFSMLLAGM